MLGGPVTAFAADGHGGWFLGGNFLTVEGVECPRLAHLRADGSLDRRWCVAPDSSADALTSASVHALTVTRSRLYVGGDFDRIAGHSRSSAAAFELATAKLLPWHPRFHMDGSFCGGERSILKIAATRSTVFIGGCFRSVGGRPRQGLAAVDAASGKPTPWRPHFADGHREWALAPGGDSLLVVGLWLAPDAEGWDDVARSRLARVDARTGAVKRWYPTPNGDFSIEASGATIYLGGEFSRIGGLRRRNLAAIDAATGAVTAWRPNPNDTVDVLVPARRRVYVAGYFKRIGGSRRLGLAAVDSRTGAAVPWRAAVRKPVVAVGVSGRGRVALGHWESQVRGLTRAGMAAIDTASGRVTKWNPRISGGAVKGVAVDGETLFIAGGFTRVGAHKRNGLAAIDRRNGRVLPWSPKNGGGWEAIAVSNGIVYVAREYNRAGKGKPQLSAIDARSGRTLWNRSFDEEFGTAPRPVVVGSKVFVAAAYSSDGLFVLDAATGRMKKIPVKIETATYGALAATDELLYVATDDGVSAVDPSTGVERWGVSAGGGGVTTMVVDHDILYLGGYFDRIGGQQRMRLAAVDTQSGELKPWRPEPAAGVEAMHVAGPRLYFSGDFDGHVASVPLAEAR